MRETDSNKCFGDEKADYDAKHLQEIINKNIEENVKIRPMQSEDVKLVYELSARCFTVPWTESSLSKELDNHLAYYCVAEHKGNIVGYGGMWMIAGEGEVTNIAVDKEYRGEGIGQAILNNLMQIGQEKTLLMIHLEVRAGNEVAQKLYKSAGFEKITVRKGYYQKPTEDAVVMIYQY